MLALRSSAMTMEHTLRCNHLKCRKSLNDHAVVTTCRYASISAASTLKPVPVLSFPLTMYCSHVFCIECSNRCQISGQQDGQRPVCPACGMQLPNPDDVVVTNLNPTEDYKTSVLSGLTPNVIIECAGRALGFWAYQTTQEMSVGMPALKRIPLIITQPLSRVPCQELSRQICLFKHSDGQDCA